MTGEGTAVFLTDDGGEFSVRSVQHHTATATTTLEPLYATDVELMNGVTGQLRVPSGQTLRGTLRQRGNVFVLDPEQKDERVLEQPDTTSTPTPRRNRRSARSAKKRRRRRHRSRPRRRRPSNLRNRRNQQHLHQRAQ